MEGKYFSKYVRKIMLNENETILYNSYNGSIIVLENMYLEHGLADLNEEQNGILEQNGYFVASSFIDKEVEKNMRKFQSDTLSIIIEMTEQCNLKCSYCYQNDWEFRSGIAYENLNYLLTYIENCFLHGEYKMLEVSFFGGEPLLEQEKILYMYNELKKICSKHSIELKAIITTNGTLLRRDFLEQFENIRLVISLTLKDDHNLNRGWRNSENRDSVYDKIVNNILICKDLLERKNSVFELRYNTHSQNINRFEEFVKAIVDLNLHPIIKTAYAYEHAENCFVNGLPFAEYKIWNSSKVIDILVKYNLPVKIGLNIMQYPCKAYYKHNLKMFSDGYLGLCNAFDPKHRKSMITDVKDDIDKIFGIFKEKDSFPLLEDKCLQCKERFLCGGNMFCKEQPCNYGFIDMGIFLKTYVKNVEAGKAELFE